ncbi:MAG: AEC family transporter [Clostridia bacterium]|nr:AEC family transporter [Clostridia bacterium]MBR4457718.1 AEC family transporter [Clostridia bacterium]
MKESFLAAFGAVLPFLIYLGLGYFAVRVHIADRKFMEQLNRFVFRLIFPFMTFYNVYKATEGGMPSLKLMLFCGIGIIALIIVLMLIVPRFVLEDRRRGVVVQAIFRSNYVLYGVSMTTLLFPEHASIAGVMTLEVVSIFNIAAVIVLEYYNRENGQRIKLYQLPLRIIQNPLLDGCLLGLLFLVLGLRLPPMIEKPVKALSDLTTPVAMITLGGTLMFKDVKRNMNIIAPVIVIRLLILPVIMLALAWLIGLRDVELFLVLMGFGTPIATSSYSMAANMGGDGDLAGELVFVSTVLSLITIFAFIFFMKQLQLIP